MNPEAQAMLSDDKPSGVLIVREDEAKRYNILKWVGLALLALSGIAQIILVAAFESFDVDVETVTVLRRGANAGSNNAYPLTTIAPFGVADTSLYFAIAQLFAALGFVLVLVLHGKEIDQISLGSDGYLWGSFIIGQVPLFLAVALLSGASSVIELTLLSAVVFAWIGVFLLGDVINQYFYRNAMYRFGGYTWSWAFLVVAALLFLVYIGIVITHMVFTFFPGADAVAAGVVAPSSALIAVPIATIVIYLVFIVFILAHYLRWFFEKTIDIVFALQIVQLVFALVVPWLALGINFGIEAPAP